MVRRVRNLEPWGAIGRAGPPDDDVPTISRFFGITIAMFFDDHGFPHFHARHAKGEAKMAPSTSR
jgi:Domain of unknown function (DUF4160)